MNAQTPFTPVPTRKRIAGWTAEKQMEFLRHLSTFGSVKAAARAVGMTESSAYRMRARPGAETFGKAWDMALHQAANGLLALAVDRAINGTPRDYWKDGKLIGTQVARSERLLMWAVDRLNPRNNGNWKMTADKLLDACQGFSEQLVVDEQEIPYSGATLPAPD